MPDAPLSSQHKGDNKSTPDTQTHGSVAQNNGPSSI